MINLRRIESGDIDPLRIERNKPEIMRWCRQNDLISYDDQMQWFQRQNADPTMRMYSVYNDGHLVGCCGLTSIDLINRHAEFSCFIFVDEQGVGHAETALKQLFDKGFSDMNLNMIWGETVGSNPSLRLFTEKLGMKVDGKIPEFYYKEGEYQDSTRISMLKDNWVWKTSN